MKNYFLLCLFITLTSCQSIKLNQSCYILSGTSVTDLGSIGQAQKRVCKRTFDTKSFPKLENKIRVNVVTVPFDKKTERIYNHQTGLNYFFKRLFKKDSLTSTNQYAVISILDVEGFVNELNAPYNNEVVTLLKNTKKSSIVTSVGIVISAEISSKIKQADTYYLLNNLDNKYTLALYKEGKKTEIIEVFSEKVLGYQLGKFCWAMNTKNQWYVADVVRKCKSCKGNTYAKIKKKKKTKSLFDM